MKLLKTLIVPPSSGSTRPSALIPVSPEMRLRTDQRVRRHFREFGPKWSIRKPLAVNVFQLDAGLNPDDQILANIPFFMVGNEMFAMLSYIGQNIRSLMRIPEGKDEVNIIFAQRLYSWDCGYHIEHEVKGENHEVHLHTHDTWDDDPPMALSPA